MPSTNGHGPERAILYARVSTDEQAKSGYSLAQQLGALGGRLEEQVWEEVCGVLADPEQLRADLEAVIEQERNGLRRDPEQEMEVWLDKLSEVDSKRSRFQDMAAEGLIAFEELGAKLNELEETRTTVRRELESLGHRQQHLTEQERDKDAVLEYYEQMAPDAPYSLTPEQRNHFYKALRLEVVMKPGGGMEICGPFSENPVVSKTAVSS